MCIWERHHFTPLVVTNLNRKQLHYKLFMHEGNSTVKWQNKEDVHNASVFLYLDAMRSSLFQPTNSILQYHNYSNTFKIHSYCFNMAVACLIIKFPIWVITQYVLIKKLFTCLQAFAFLSIFTFFYT